ncbi:MAG: hypothetical protein ACFFHV_06655 [Promethearchaeota archaeon]
MTNNIGEQLQDWERELLADHRWGRLKIWFPNDQIILESYSVSNVHKNLKNLWNKAKPLNETSKDILNDILALEICNWNLENSILDLCKAIGEEKSPTLQIGHLKSITNERWKKVWAYYLTLRNWLPFEGVSGYEILQKLCDPEILVKNKIFDLLGERNGLKEMYVERLCLLFEFWLSGYISSKRHPYIIAHNAAVKAIEKKILKQAPKSKILQAMKFEGDGRLQPCNHKAFRRYDIIISSIGVNKWRSVIAERGIDGLERSEYLNKYLSAIELWIKGYEISDQEHEDKLLFKIHALLGKPDDTKKFLASLLILLLRPQQIAAKQLAERRLK